MHNKARHFTRREVISRTQLLLHISVVAIHNVNMR